MIDVDFEYKSIFIPKEVVIVESRNNVAYVCDADNPRTMATAEQWVRYNSDEEHPPKQYRYINDGFRLQIKNAAKRSSVGGKLSFWMCQVTAPDGKVFNIGVNADLLCELLCYSMFIAGKCQEDVRFGTFNSQYGFYTESMPSYKAYVESNNLRDKLKTSSTVKYKAGDIVRTLTESKLYLGEMYQYMDVGVKNCAHLYPWMVPSISELEIIVYKTPRKYHAFATSYRPDEWEFWPECGTGLLKKKPKRILTGAKFDSEAVLDKFYDSLVDSSKQALATLEWHPRRVVGDLMYGSHDQTTDEHIELIKTRMNEFLKKMFQAGKLKSFPSITYRLEI